MLATLTVFIIFVALCFAVGGAAAALARNRSVDVSSAESIAVALGLGFLLICFVSTLVSGLVGLFSRFEMGRFTCLGIGLILGLGLCLAVWRRHGSATLLDWKKQLDLPFIGFLAFVFVVYLFTYDSHLLVQVTCALRAGLVPHHNYLSHETAMLYVPEYMIHKNAFLIWPNGIRLGPTFLIAPFLALFKLSGLRLLHAFCGVLIAAFSFAGGQRFLGRKSLAYLAAVAVALNPLILSIPHIDENVLALAPAAAAFYFLLSPAYSSWAAGAMFGLAVGCRHVLIILVPVMLFPYVIKDQWKKAGVYCLGLLAACAPWITVHVSTYLAFSSLGYESFAIRPGVDYELFGYRFVLRAFLSWPLTDEVLRSPYNGFPTLVSYPLTAIRTFGILFSGACLAGLLKGGGLTLLKRIVSVLWIVPIMAILMVQAGWEEPNKMGLLLIVSSPLGLLGAAGVGAALGGKDKLNIKKLSLAYSRRGMIAWFVAALLVTIFTLVARSPDYKLDERTVNPELEEDARNSPVTPPRVTLQEQVLADSERRQLGALHLLPDLSMAIPLASARLLLYRGAEVWGDLARPEYNRRYTAFRDLDNQAMALEVDKSKLAEMAAGPPGGPPGGPPPGRSPEEYRDALYGQVMSGEEFLPGPGDMPDGGVGHPHFEKLLAATGAGGLTAIPMTMIIDRPFDEVDGLPDHFSCDGTATPESVAVTLNLLAPPVSQADFAGPADHAEGIALPPGRLVIVKDIKAPWAPQERAHIVAMTSLEGAVNISIMVGGISFDLLDGLCHATVTSAAGSSEVTLLLPASSPVYIRQYTSIRPRCFHGWRGVTSDDSLELSLPFRTSY